MIEVIMCLAAIFGIALFVKDMDGPFDIMNKTRLTLFGNKYVGVFFYKLMSCYFCLGTWSGVIVYLLHNHLKNIHWEDMIVWGFGGAVISLVSNLLIGKLIEDNNEHT